MTVALQSGTDVADVDEGGNALALAVAGRVGARRVREELDAVVAGGKVPLSFRGPKNAGSNCSDIMEMIGPPAIATCSETRPPNIGAMPRLEAFDI